jgi:hypothetical protein
MTVKMSLAERLRAKAENVDYLGEHVAAGLMLQAADALEEAAAAMQQALAAEARRDHRELHGRCSLRLL